MHYVGLVDFFNTEDDVLHNEKVTMQQSIEVIYISETSLKNIGVQTHPTSCSANHTCEYLYSLFF